MGSAPDPRQPRDSGLPDGAIRDQLDRVLASEVFSRSERLASFLRFVVVETLAGRGHTLKEQVIAATLYRERVESAGDDGSVVRADARRLRDKLREYYSEFPLEPVVISLQKGSYTPAFARGAAPKPRVAAGKRPLPLRLLLVCAAGAVAVAAVWSMGGSPAPAPQIFPLTQDAGGEGMPSLSPDGNFVAYQHWDPPGPSAQDIWVKAVRGEARRRLTETPPPVAEHSPAWSPDGTEIAFERVGFARPNLPGQGIFVVSVLGGPERKIADSGRDPKWAVDGRSILIRDGSPVSIFQIDLTTLARRQITKPAGGDADGRFDISPDGTTLAFIRGKRSGGSDIYVVPMAGGSPRQVTSWDASMTGLTWAADGRSIIYDVGSQSLWRVPADLRVPGKGKPVPGLEGLNTSAATAVSPSMSRPARGPARLAFQVQKIDVSLRLVELSPGADDVLPAKPFLDADRIDMPGAFAPDGGRVLFYSYLAGAPVQMWIANRDGSGASRIQPIQASRVKPGAWSPDGHHFTFAATIGGHSEIYTAAEGGGEVRQVTSDRATDISPCWSADGKWIYYASNRSGRFEIWRVAFESGTGSPITRSGGVDPAPSPDGKMVYYLDPMDSTEPKATVRTARLKAVPSDGGEESVVLQAVRRGLWGVTEKGILMLAAEADYEAVDLYSWGSGKVARSGRLAFLVPKEFPGITFSRDGRWALTNHVDRRESDLMFIDNFR